MLMSGFRGGGSCLLNSSEKALQYRWNSSGIPFREGRVLLFHSLLSQSWARVDHFKNNFTFAGSSLVLVKVL